MKMLEQVYKLLVFATLSPNFKGRQCIKTLFLSLIALLLTLKAGAKDTIIYYSYSNVNVSGSSLPFTHPSLTSRWAPFWLEMPITGAKVERANCLAIVVKVDVPSDTAVVCEMRNVSASHPGTFYADVYTSDPSASSSPSALYYQTMGTVTSPGMIAIPDSKGYGYGKTYWVRII